MKQEQQLRFLLNQETSSLQQLENVLKQEYDALMATNIEAIESAISLKNQALASQADATMSRKNFTTQLSVDHGDEGLQQLIASCDNSDELAASIAGLTSLAKQCHDANRTNGRLIMEKQQRAILALNIVRQTDNNLPVYSGQGKALNKPSSRSLGKA